jgi:hypothetical protein
MALPILPSTTDTRSITERANVLIKNYNREDTRVPIYALDTGTATAYEIAPVPGIEMYVVGQIFAFKAENANSGTAPTFAVNGLTAGTITYPDGSALLPGDIAANGFYFVQVASTTPTFHLMNSPKRRTIQTVSTVTGAVATGTTVIPFDDTIPQQSTDGDQYMSLAITPKSATSTLVIDVVVNACGSVGTTVLIGALFQDSTANALAASWQELVSANFPVSLSFRHVMTSGTTSATTFKVRAGLINAGTTTFNGQLGGRILGGVLASSIVIREVLP